VNEPTEKSIGGAFHRAKTSAPRRPFERPARASPSFVAWPPRCWSSTLLSLQRAPCGNPPKTPILVHTLRLPAGRASLNLGAVRRLLQPMSTRGHTQRAVVLRTRVRLSPRYSPAPTDAGCVGPAARYRDRSLRTAHCTLRLSHGAFHLRGRVSCTGRSARAKTVARALDEVARALLVTLRTPGSPIRRALRPGKPGGSSHRPRSFLDTTSRKVAPSRRSGCLLPRRNPYTSGELLLRARLDPAPVTRPPWRLCPGGRPPLLPVRSALL